MKQLAKDQRGFMERRMGNLLNKAKRNQMILLVIKRFFGAVLQQVHFRRSC